MASPVESASGAAGGVPPQDGALLGYLATHGHRLLIVVFLIAFLVYAVFWMRRRVPIVREFLAFLRARKLWWMLPIVIVFLLLAILIVTMESSVIAPFIYPILG